jgi:hypothetical protein
MTNADTENITAKTARPIIGARESPQYSGDIVPLTWDMTGATVSRKVTRGPSPATAGTRSMLVTLHPDEPAGLALSVPMGRWP